MILISFLKIPGIGIGIDIFFKNCQYWYWCWDRIEEYLVLVSVLVLTLKIPRIDIDIDIVILSYRMKQQYPLKRAGIAHLCHRCLEKDSPHCDGVQILAWFLSSYTIKFFGFGHQFLWRDV